MNVLPMKAQAAEDLPPMMTTTTTMTLMETSMGKDKQKHMQTHR
jgi:hypothetical protein